MRDRRYRFTPGQTVYVRHFQGTQLGGVYPFRVVLDRPDGVLLWAATGTTYWHLDMPDGRRLAATPLAEWSATRRVPVARRSRHGTLCWHPVGADHSVRWFFHPDGRFHAWYANLEAPAVAWRDTGLAGLDTVDWDLDVWVHPDRRWEWKDADLFAARLAEPEGYWVDDPERVRRAGRAVVAQVEAGVFPFDGTWCDFRPDPDWPAGPTGLPAGWRRPRAAPDG
jgi:hypothetical protein